MLKSNKKRNYMKYFGTPKQLKSIIENNTAWNINENCGNVDIQIKTTNKMIFNFFILLKLFQFKVHKTKKIWNYLNRY